MKRHRFRIVKKKERTGMIYRYAYLCCVHVVIKVKQKRLCVQSTVCTLYTYTVYTYTRVYFSS